MNAPDNFPKLVLNARVRFKSEIDAEPVGTITEVGYCSVRITWDDEHPVSLICPSSALEELEVVVREDIHKPSSIVPDDYQYVAEECIRIEGLGDALALKAQREIIAAHRAQTGGTYAQVDTTGNCQVCGSVNAIYTSLFYHAKSNTYVRMGHDCADKCHCGGEFERNAFRRAIQDVREAQAGKRKAQALLADAGLTAAWDLYVLDYDKIPTLITKRDAEGQIIVTQLPYEEHTIRDIVGKFVKYGSISDATMALLTKLTLGLPERDRRNAEWKAKREEEKAAAAPCPKGRVKVSGTVLKVEDRETDFGMVRKMTVKADEGFIVWGSVPSGAGDAQKDCKITFIATITPSETDTKFGFAKRPLLYVSPEEKKALKAAQKEQEAL